MTVAVTMSIATVHAVPLIRMGRGANRMMM